MLETGRGLLVLGDDGGPIVLPQSQKIDIGQDGTVSVLPLGQQARIKLVSPDPSQLVKGADGLLRTRDGQPAEASADVRVLSGVLESSNVSATEALNSRPRRRRTCASSPAFWRVPMSAPPRR